MKVVVSGGGTGGHIMPAIAIVEALRKIDPTSEVLFIGGSSGMETEIVPRSGIPFRAVQSRKLRKLLSVSTFGVLWSLLQGFREARKVIKDFQADAVVGTGGYAAAATALAGASLNIPTILHEGNFLAGRTNRLVARFARKICVTFPETVNQFPDGKGVWTGLPIRKSIVAPEQMSKQLARASFKELDPNRFTLLVIGGSQGAKAINTVIVESLPYLFSMGIQVIHQTGQKNIENVLNLAEAAGFTMNKGHLPVAFLDGDELPLALRAADLMVCRGGISTLAEAMVNGLPAIVVPLPTAYADHQTYNARAVERGGGAVHLAEHELSSEKLISLIKTLQDEPNRLAFISECAMDLGKPDAGEEVANIVIAQGRKNLYKT